MANGSTKNDALVALLRILVKQFQHLMKVLANRFDLPEPEPLPEDFDQVADLADDS